MNKKYFVVLIWLSFYFPQHLPSHYTMRSMEWLKLKVYKSFNIICKLCGERTSIVSTRK